MVKMQKDRKGQHAAVDAGKPVYARSMNGTAHEPSCKRQKLEQAEAGLLKAKPVRAAGDRMALPILTIKQNGVIQHAKELGTLVGVQAKHAISDKQHKHNKRKHQSGAAASQAVPAVTHALLKGEGLRRIAAKPAPTGPSGQLAVPPTAQHNAALVSSCEHAAAVQKRQGKGNGAHQPEVQATSLQAVGDWQPPVKRQKQSGAPPVVLRKGAAPVNSNWAAMQQAVKAQDVAAQAPASHRRHPNAQPLVKKPRSVGADNTLTPILAMDCEMVGVGTGGSKSVLARVCIVNSAGNVLLDTFVRPEERVTDFRTWVSGVRPADIIKGRPHAEVVQEVGRMVTGRVIVGHALHNDFKVLQLEHPPALVRDTARFPPLMKALPGGRLIPQALRDLSSNILGLAIQAGEHSPVDDARCALYLYQKHKREWDALVRSGHAPDHAAHRKASALHGKMRKRKEAMAMGDISTDPFADL